LCHPQLSYFSFSNNCLSPLPRSICLGPVWSFSSVWKVYPLQFSIISFVSFLSPSANEGRSRTVVYGTFTPAVQAVFRCCRPPDDGPPVKTAFPSLHLSPLYPATETVSIPFFVTVGAPTFCMPFPPVFPISDRPGWWLRKVSLS